MARVYLPERRFRRRVVTRQCGDPATVRDAVLPVLGVRFVRCSEVAGESQNQRRLRRREEGGIRHPRMGAVGLPRGCRR